MYIYYTLLVSLCRQTATRLQYVSLPHLHCGHLASVPVSLTRVNVPIFPLFWTSGGNISLCALAIVTLMEGKSQILVN